MDAALLQYFDQLSERLQTRLTDAIREQAQMLSDAQRDTLRSLQQSPEETGDLEASCVIVEGDEPAEFIVQAGGELTTKQVREGSGQPFDYALAFEFGTSRQPARPFFYSTYREREGDIREAIASAVDTVLKG